MLILLRHGETKYHNNRVMNVFHSSSLNEVGLYQSNKYGDFLIKNNVEIQTFFSSPNKKAIETSNIVKEKVGCEYLVCNELSELHKTSYLVKFWSFWKFRSDEKKKYDELRNFLESISYCGKNYLIISHGRVIKMIVRILTNEEVIISSGFINIIDDKNNFSRINVN